MANRKLQGEIDRVLKKVDEGVAVFEATWEKVYSATSSSQKEKHEGELKREIKKLQRLRDQIKTWQGDSSIKDKSKLDTYRKLIEEKMEKFKVCEKETKTKAFSKEGLAQDRTDPKEKAKREVYDWIGDSISKLQEQVEEFEAEVEATTATYKKGKKLSFMDNSRVEELKDHITRHLYHVEMLEKVLRSVDNEAVSAEEANDLKDGVDYYLENNQEPDFYEDDTLYDSVDLDSVPVVVNVKGMIEDHDDDLEREPGQETTEAPPVPPAVSPAAAIPAPPKAKTLSPTAPPKIVEPAAPPKLAPPSIPKVLPAQVAPAPVVKPPLMSSIVKGNTAAAPTKSAAEVAKATPPGLPGNLNFSQAAQGAATRPGGLASIPKPASSDSVANQAQESAGPNFASLLRKSTEVPATSSTPAKVAPEPQEPSSSAARSAPFQGPGSSLPVGNPASVMHAMNSQVPLSSPTISQLPSSAAGFMGTPQPSPPGPQPQAPGAIHPTEMNAASKIQAPQRKLVSPQGNNAGASGMDVPGSSPTESNILNEISCLDNAMNFMPEPLNGNSRGTPSASGPRNVVQTPVSFPTIPAPIFDSPLVFEKFDVDTLFFIFYYQQGTYQQYLAARELKRQSWRFHKKYMTWFQRHDEPKVTSDDYEQGTYLYFDFVLKDDYDTGWCQRIKTEFTFEYGYLEDELNP